MVKQKGYMRLKLNAILLSVVISSAITGLAMLLVWGASRQTPVAAAYYAIGRGLFGRTREEMETFFLYVLLPSWPVISFVIFVVSLLVTFYLVLGRLTGWFRSISEAAHSMREEIGKAVTLPKELSDVEEDLNRVRLSVVQREQEAEESAKRAKDLVVYLAHDLKTPLTSVVGYLDLLNSQPELDAEQRARYTSIALEKAKRLEELIGEFFDINRLELESIEKKGQLLDLSMLLDQLADEFWPLFEEKDLTFHASVADGLRVWGDPEKLARVFDNILRNAVNYSISNGVVGLRAFRQGGELVVTVDNEGVEIPEQELTKIFQKFYRLDAARSTQTGGFGLGLAIAKEIVERHRGSIRAESNGKRVTFTVILPAR